MTKTTTTTTHSTWEAPFRRPLPARLRATGNNTTDTTRQHTARGERAACSVARRPLLCCSSQLKTGRSWFLPFEPALSTLLVSHCTDRCCCTTLPHPILTPSSPHPHPIQCPHPYLIAHLHSPCALCSMHMCSVPSNAVLLPHPAPPRTAPVPALVPLPPVFEGI